MPKRKFTEAEIIAALKQGEAGRTLIEVAREMGVSKHTVYAWKAKYGGMSPPSRLAGKAQRLRDFPFQDALQYLQPRFPAFSDADRSRSRAGRENHPALGAAHSAAHKKAPAA
jgi:transposase